MKQKVGEAAMTRLEDYRLLRGQGRFVDDIFLPGLLEAAFVRSTHAHALIRGIDTAAARALTGVHAVLTFTDLRQVLTCDRLPAATPAGAIRVHLDPCILVQNETCFVGEPIVMVVADTRAIAEDAASLVTIDYEPLPPVINVRSGLAPDSPQARLEHPDNCVAQWTIGYGDCETAFKSAAHRISASFELHKGGAHSMEGRGLVARPDSLDDMLTVWDSTQMPHRVKRVLVATLGLNENQVRVIAPDVGGGFGPKGPVYSEEIAVCAAARLLGKPLKWVEDRYEHFVSSNQERDQFWDVEAAFDATGKLLGIRGALLHDHGACTPSGIQLPQNSTTNLIGPYILPTYRLNVSLCLTNKTPATSTRGAGRPQGTFVMERLLDRMAARLTIGRDEIRRRNLIQPQDLPYRTQVVTRDGLPMTYDSGDYPECQRRALEAADWASFPARQAAARAKGRWIGLGLSNYVEGTGRGPFESATLRIGSSGKILVASGAASQGQGTHTMLARIAADILGVRDEQIEVTCGDTGAIAMGLGAYASRQTVTAGNALYVAANEVAQKIRQTASILLEVAPEDLELKNGFVQVKGIASMRRSFGEIAKALSGNAGFALPGGIKPGLAAAIDFEPPAITYTNGTHLAEVEVDIRSGHVKVTRYIVVHDCGNMINPKIIDGQVLGGVVHGISATLFEWMRHNADGQPLTVSFADYLLPTADTVPRIEIHHMISPTPLNPLGVKGAAESGTIGAPAAIVSAIEDALVPFGVEINQLPVTPQRLHRLIRSASSRAGA
jgi:carbon-monoxide dehydrogenase large subunit